MTRPRIIHLVDDTTAGGVMRVIDHLISSDLLAAAAEHVVLPVDRGRVSFKAHAADLLVSHLAISWRALPMLVALRLRHPGVPVIHVEHSYTEGFVAANVTHKSRFATLLRVAYRMFTRVVAVSREQGQWLRSSGAVPAKSLRVIRSCVDLEGFRGLEPVRRPVRVIGAIGRLDRQKGFDTLIRAFRALPDPGLALHVYGEGAEEASLRQIAGDDSRIQFRGFSADPVSAMAEVDAVAMPSVWEAYGLVAIEALAAGRHLLVQDIDGLKDHVPFGARTVCSDAVEVWQDALQSLIEESQAGQHAPDRIQSCDFEDAFSVRWRQIVNEVLPAMTADHQLHVRA